MPTQHPAADHLVERSAAMPLVSIILSYYNQPAYIAATVRSALAQTYPSTEVILIDDGSPIPAAPCLDDPDALRVLRTENHGCPAARNFGFAQSSGEFLLFLDGDDVLRPDAVALHLKALERTPQAGLSFGAVRIIGAQGEQLKPPHLCRPRRNYFNMLLGSNPIWSPGSTLMRRSAFVEAGGFDASLKTQVDDYDLYLRMARQHPFVRHAGCVLDYRLHGNNVSMDQDRMSAGTLLVLDRLEQRGDLSASERRKLQAGRRRWQHGLRPRNTLAYRLRSLQLKAQLLLDIPLHSLWHDV